MARQQAVTARRPGLNPLGMLAVLLASVAVAEAQPRGNVYLGYEHLTTVHDEGNVGTPQGMSGAVRFGPAVVEVTANRHHGYFSDWRTVTVLAGYYHAWQAEVRPWIAMLGGYEHTRYEDEYDGVDTYGRMVLQPGVGVDFPLLSRLFARAYFTVRFGPTEYIDLYTELRIGIGMGVTF